MQSALLTANLVLFSLKLFLAYKYFECGLTDFWMAYEVSRNIAAFRVTRVLSDMLSYNATHAFILLQLNVSVLYGGDEVRYIYVYIYIYILSFFLIFDRNRIAKIAICFRWSDICGSMAINSLTLKSEHGRYSFRHIRIHSVERKCWYID